MKLLSFLKRGTSAPVARERLQILLAHERVVTGHSNLLAKLREEILAVIAKHIPIERDQVRVKLDQGDIVSMLEVDVEIPTATEGSRPMLAAAGR